MKASEKRPAKGHHIISDQPKSTAKMHSLQPPNLPDIGSATCRLAKNKKKQNQSNQPIPSPPIKKKTNSPGADFQTSLTSHPKSFKGQISGLG